jgi:hypothetical protein
MGPHAMAATEGKGFNEASRTVEGAMDWEAVKKIVKALIDARRKQYEPLLATACALPPSASVEGDINADSAISGNEERPAAVHPIGSTSQAIPASVSGLK